MTPTGACVPGSRVSASTRTATVPYRTSAMSFRPTSTRGRHRARGPGADETVEVNHHAGTLRRHWRMVALLTLAAAGLAVVHSARQTPVYQAMASVLVRPLSVTPIQTGLRPDQVVDMASE